MDLNFEYIAAHISDYINNENFFYIFDIEDIKTIMKYSHLTADQYVTLLKQSHSTINSRKLYTSTRNANITIKNIEEVVSILKSVKNYMKFSIFNGIIDFLIPDEKAINSSTNETEIIQNENETKDTTISQTNENYNSSQDILTRIKELKDSNDFETIYKFLDELSSKGNHEMISKSIEAGLWQKIAPKKSLYDPERNVLHVASENGNLRLVQSLIKCVCDKEAKDSSEYTPLILASKQGHLDIVQYLISVGANKEAKTNSGYTPLIYASNNGHLEVVKYLFSVGANKEAKDNYGYTPLIKASTYGHLNVVQYLISVGANKEAKNNNGYTALMVAKGNVRNYLKTICIN
ncbi:hypothetical protein TVAG_034710 [Trichomonas vaginalis G3]|uniref:Uncharacterized protein n=1 Tax=Trichomonas vaginalis (strain ATCC PRA-98 / G3) TaxID=412133 RepID=A2FJ81_TRIV3|nr:spectrin binding [Trichomonas vaginalis G3]EAX95042.1 hypothetical protein TVAG_034710 [Trichomonas vaginalis G3]KAI5537444.1 spectrin binding [Trichomonas vaginalis G3]|eukprot:XP_001307972.1 hypothetical protein [Trichomonas vaginalis G3]